MVGGSTARAGFTSAEPETGVHDAGVSVSKLFDKLDILKGRYLLHLACTSGPTSYVDRRSGSAAWAIGCTDSGMGRGICLW
jgi:hypothetical protein